MQTAARLALRGHGWVEPNPMVGCVIVDPAGKIVGWGYHRRFGAAHAEVEALNRAGPHARGATAYVTLEPCDHHGKAPPCTDALIAAGIRRVVFARADPHRDASGGAERLRSAGLVVEHCPESLPGPAPSDPFVYRVQTGLPRVVAKWAQSIDGRIATRTGESQWISSERSRRCVHRERGRVDAILTGIGTVLADDPMLTARAVRVRRIARRVIIDPKLQISANAKLVVSARDIPITVCCVESALQGADAKPSLLRAAGVEIIALPLSDHPMALAPLLRELSAKYDITTILVEAGAGLLSRLLSEQLVNEAWVFIAPLLLADENALPAARGMNIEHLRDALHPTVIDSRIRSGDIMLRYRFAYDHGQ